ncbi:site-specific DNA-methyltransferase [Treponema phagedenis]|nr:site-specific DNA-methyltransferase [Treponema phagedenis]
MYFFCDWRSYAFYYPPLDSVMQVKNLLVWKKHGRPSLNIYGSGHELIMFSGKIKKSYQTNIIDGVASFNSGARKTNGEKIHPTQKPIELMEKFIFDSTDEGDVVDYFGKKKKMDLELQKSKMDAEIKSV